MDTWRVALLALTMIMEARNQPELGKAMVAQVAMNRGGQENIEQNLFWPAQFAAWGQDVYGPGYSLRLAVLECSAMGAFPDDPWCIERWMDGHHPTWWRQLRVGSPENWHQVWSLAEAVYQSAWQPPPDLAHKTHFDNPIFWPDGLPPWLTNCTRVGDHVFCD
jgi:hypothetical protein